MLKGPIKTNKNQSRTKKTLGKPKKPNISRSGDIGAGWLASHPASQGCSARQASQSQPSQPASPASQAQPASQARPASQPSPASPASQPMSPDLEILVFLGFPKVFLVLDWFLLVLIEQYSKINKIKPKC